MNKDEVLGDPRRVATPSMTGYSYQILHSILAWLDLGPNETLFLEGAEDFDHVGEGDATLTQVKHLKRPVTLRSHGSAQAICNFWNHREKNKGRVLKFRYLTTAEIGMEDGDPMKLGVPGVLLWEQIAQRDPALPKEAPARLRAFLRGTSQFPSGFKKFLKEAPNEQFLSFVSSMSWETGVGDQEALITELKDKLVVFGQRKGISAKDSEATLGELYLEAWQCATRDKGRALTQADFHRAFDNATTVSIPKSIVNKAALHGSTKTSDMQHTMEVIFPVGFWVFSVGFGAVIWSATGSRLLSVTVGIFSFVVLLLFRRNLGILAAGGKTADTEARQAYNRLRESLEKGGYAAQLFVNSISGFLDAIDYFFGDVNRPSRKLSPRLFRLNKPVPLWTSPAFDRCILIAAIYPLTSIIFFWSISGSVGQVQRVLRLSSGMDSWELRLQFAAFTLEAVAIWNLFQTRGWLSAAWAIGGGSLAMAAAIAAAGVFRVAWIFAVAGIGAAAIGACLFIAGVPFIAFNAAVSGVGVVAGLIAGGITFGYFGGYNVGFGSITGASAAVLVAGTITARSNTLLRESSGGVLLTIILLALIVLCICIGCLLSPQLETWGKVGPMLLFIGLLPMLTAPFDWVSIGLTRGLMHRGVERGAWWPLFYAIIDATIAVVLVVCLALILLISTQLFNHMATAGGGRPVVELGTLLDGITAERTSKEFWWVYGLLLTTLIPSAINLMIGGASLMSGAPGLPRILLSYMPKDGPPALPNQTLIAVVWTFQVLGGALIGVAVQIGLIYAVIGVAMPAIGLDLLAMCRAAFRLDLPALLMRI